MRLYQMLQISPWDNHLSAAHITKMALGQCSIKGVRSLNGATRLRDLARLNQNAWRGAATCL